MKKPQALLDLLKELKEEAFDSSVKCSASGYVRLYIDAEEITLRADEVEVLFHSPETAIQLYQALDEPEDASVEFHDVAMLSEVIDALEKHFLTVDEV